MVEARQPLTELQVSTVAAAQVSPLAWKMSVVDSYTEEPVHTYKDDITYQIVKDSHRRSSFCSCDHQIVSTGADRIKSIEKNEKLVTSDLRRSQTALMGKLEQLQNRQRALKTKQRKHSGSENENALSRRRFSTPLVNFSRLAHASKEEQNCHQQRQQTRSPRHRSKGGSTGSIGGEDDIDGPHFSMVLGRSSRNSSGSVSPPDMKEARRLSFVAQEETSKKALEKLDALVAEHKRRATIAFGASQGSGLLPNASQMARLAEIAARSISIEEEDDVCSLGTKSQEDDA